MSTSPQQLQSMSHSHLSCLAIGRLCTHTKYLAVAFVKIKVPCCIISALHVLTAICQAGNCRSSGSNSQLLSTVATGTEKNSSSFQPRKLAGSVDASTNSIFLYIMCFMLTPLFRILLINSVQCLFPKSKLIKLQEMLDPPARG